MMRAFPDKHSWKRKEKARGKRRAEVYQNGTEENAKFVDHFDQREIYKQLIKICTTVIFLNADRQNTLYTQLEK